MLEDMENDLYETDVFDYYDSIPFGDAQRFEDLAVAEDMVLGEDRILFDAAYWHSDENTGNGDWLDANHEAFPAEDEPEICAVCEFIITGRKN